MAEPARPEPGAYHAIQVFSLDIKLGRKDNRAVQLRHRLGDGMADQMIDRYSEYLSKLRTEVDPKDWPATTLGRAPHKALLLLSVIDAIEDGAIRTNTVELSSDLRRRFAYYWTQILRDRPTANPLTPFRHLARDGFWHILPREQTRVPLAARLDDDLYSLFVQRESRQELRRTLIDAHFRGEAAAILSQATGASIGVVAEIIDPEIKLNPIRTQLEGVLSEYGQIPPRTPLQSGHPLVVRFQKLRQLLAQAGPVVRRRTLRVDQSTGRGAKSKVPWIAFLDSRETTSTRRGVYCVYLFRQDLSGVYLTLNQGASGTEKHFYSVSGASRAVLRSNAGRLKQYCRDLESHGFSLETEIDLRTDSGLGLGYEAGTVAHKFYAAGAIPDDHLLVEDVDAVLGAYDRYLAERPATVGPRGSESRTTEPPQADVTERQYWALVADPTRYRIEDAIRERTSTSWIIQGRPIKRGDRVAIWKTLGRDGRRGVVALGEVLADPSPHKAEDDPYWIRPPVASEKDRWVVVRFVRLPNDPVWTPHHALDTLSVARARGGTVFRITPPQWDVLLTAVGGWLEGAPAPVAEPIEFHSAHLLAERLPSATTLENDERDEPPLEEAVADPPSQPGAESLHTKAQWQLARMGRALGLDVWIPPNDRHRVFQTEKLADLSIRELPGLGLSNQARDIIGNIDVLWIDAGLVLCAFEVEHTTTVYSGLLRLADLVAVQPYTHIRLFIVAGTERRDKVARELARPTFALSRPPLRTICRFLSYERLDEQFTFAEKIGRYLKIDWVDNLADAWEGATGIADQPTR